MTTENGYFTCLNFKFCIVNLNIKKPKKNSNSTHFIQRFLSRQNLYTLLGRSQSSSSSPYQSSGNYSQGLFQKTIKIFDCKINGLAIGGNCSHSLGQSNWTGKAQTQAISKLAQLASSCCGQQQAQFRKDCYHSCYTDFVLELKMFEYFHCFVIFVL